MTRNDSDAYEYLVTAVGDLNGPQILSVSISLSLSVSLDELATRLCLGTGRTFL